MKLFTTLVPAVAVIALLAPSAYALSPPADLSSVTDMVADCDTLKPHAPIRVDGDADFLSPASGVTSGSGTASDPYVICGWDIHGGANYGVEIKNVRSHVVFKNNRVHDTNVIARVYQDGMPSEYTYSLIDLGDDAHEVMDGTARAAHFGHTDTALLAAAVKFMNVSHVEVTDNELIDNALKCQRIDAPVLRGESCAGVNVSNCSHRCSVTPIGMSAMRGLVIWDAERAVVTRNVVTNTSGTGVVILANDVSVTSNRIHGARLIGPAGGGEAVSLIAVASTGEAVIKDNELERAMVGGPNLLVESNNARTILVTQSRGAQVRGNTLDALGIDRSDGADVRGNEISGSASDGIVAIASSNVEIHGNNIGDGGTFGVRSVAYDTIPQEDGGVESVIIDGPQVDASNNWWGCALGPGAAGCGQAGPTVIFAPHATAPFTLS